MCAGPRRARRVCSGRLCSSPQASPAPFCLSEYSAHGEPERGASGENVAVGTKGNVRTCDACVRTRRTADERQARHASRFSGGSYRFAGPNTICSYVPERCMPTAAGHYLREPRTCYLGCGRVYLRVRDIVSTRATGILRCSDTPLACICLKHSLLVSEGKMCW